MGKSKWCVSFFVGYTFTYVCIFAPYSKIRTGVNSVHVNGALDNYSTLRPSATYNQTIQHI